MPYNVTERYYFIFICIFLVLKYVDKYAFLLTQYYVTLLRELEGHVKI